MPIFLPIAQLRLTANLRSVHLRPATVKEVAERSDFIEEFGRHLRDWLHEVRRVSSRAQASATIADEPSRLHEKVPQGQVADAWLAAYAEHLAGKIGLPAPEWSFAPWRTAAEPIFDESDSRGSGCCMLHFCPDVVEKGVEVAETAARVRHGVCDGGEAREFGVGELIDDRHGGAFV